jgi:hypothetical protein
MDKPFEDQLPQSTGEAGRPELSIPGIDLPAATRAI